MKKLNRLVAVEVVGWKSTMVRPSHWPETMVITNLMSGQQITPYAGPWLIPPDMSWDHSPANGVEVPDFTGDIASAWVVVNACLDSGLSFGIHNNLGSEWECSFMESEVFWQSKHANPATAICLAALQAFNVSEDDVKEAMK